MNNIFTAEKSRRIISGLIDLIIIFIVSVLFFICYSKVYLENDEKYNNALQTQITIIEESHLYTKNNSSWTLIKENYDECLTEFYEIYDYDTTSGDASYEAAKEKSGFFENGILKEQFDENDEGVRDFFSNQMVLALETLAKNPSYQEAAKIVNKLNTIGTDVALFLSSAIFMLVVPFTNKNRKSIGKQILKLEIKSKHGNKLHWIQLIMRFLINTIVVLYFSIVMPGIFIIINACFILFSKNGTSIADLFADTLVKKVGADEIKEETSL